FASTHPSGALTFRFLSDGIITRPGWVADITCLPVPPPNDLIVNAIDVDQFPQAYTDSAVRLQFATNELLNPQGCSIAGTNGVWYKFTATADGSAQASITTPSGASAVIFYSAPNENVSNETELTYTFGQTNQCGPGTSSTVATLAGQSYYLFVLNTGGQSDVVVDLSNTLGTNDNVIDGFTFYPNPMNNVLNISSKTNIENVVIYNMLGQKIMDQNIGATSTQLQVTDLATGAYLMKVVSEGQTGTYRLIKR
ncbi:MAG: T9SS type A sorting domain-containing protein, partial [Flavobacteriales bacterium]|nr:T9SS type A sorting domain-containing protein [Flavobacteriales bacterium]